MYSPSIDSLIAALRKLPGVGPHTAERYTFHFLKSGKKEVAELTNTLQTLMQNTKSCGVCWNFSHQNPCPICADKKRDQKILCVVAEPQDLAALEKTKIFSGVYHVLRGVVDATETAELQNLKINELLARVLPGPKAPSEILLAFSPTLLGETTMLYLEKELKKQNSHLKISRLARGLALGADLRYADQDTLGSAITNRRVN